MECMYLIEIWIKCFKVLPCKKSKIQREIERQEGGQSIAAFHSPQQPLPQTLLGFHHRIQDACQWPGEARRWLSWGGERSCDTSESSLGFLLCVHCGLAQEFPIWHSVFCLCAFGGRSASQIYTGGIFSHPISWHSVEGREPFLWACVFDSARLGLGFHGAHGLCWWAGSYACCFHYLIVTLLVQPISYANWQLRVFDSGYFSFPYGYGGLFFLAHPISNLRGMFPWFRY